MQTLAVALLGFALLGGDAKCPISGKPAKEEHSIEVNGKKISFCCDKCPKAYEKKIGLTDDGAKKCPLTKKDAKAETRLIHQKAEAVYFCCNKCPTKYAENEKLTVVDKGPKTCPACDKEAKADHSLSINGEKVYYCCGGCQEKHLKSLGVAAKDPGKCPISNHAAKKDSVLIRVKSEAVYFCCNNCRGKYAKENFKEEEKGGKVKEKEKKID